METLKLFRSFFKTIIKKNFFNKMLKDFQKKDTCLMKPVVQDNEVLIQSEEYTSTYICTTRWQTVSVE